MESWSTLTVLLELLRKSRRVRAGTVLISMSGYYQLMWVGPLQALQLIQGEVKDVGHVMIRRPAASQLVLTTEEREVGV